MNSVKNKKVIERITWLDSCRGLAILFLIAIHYVDAIQGRGFISQDLLYFIKSLLRVATSFFIFTFGFTFYIAYKKKVEINKVLSIYNKSLFQKLLYIIIAREVIVCILAIRYPTMLETLPEILTFQMFSFSGEILIFYFFAILVAPLNIRFLLKSNLATYILTWCAIYIASFYIGSTYVNENSSGVLRFLFYDIYPYFPFLFVMATGMLMASLYQKIECNKKRITFSLTVSLTFIMVGLMGFYSLSSDILYNLAKAIYKTPPNIFYLSFYMGLTILIISTLAWLEHFKYIPKSIHKVLSTIGRYSLFAYVLHYSFFLASYIPKWFGLSSIWEVILMFFMFLLSYLCICWWDKFKKYKIN